MSAARDWHGLSCHLGDVLTNLGQLAVAALATLALLVGAGFALYFGIAAVVALT